MLRIVFVVIVALSLWSTAARADWYMIGPEEFHPESSNMTGAITTTGYHTSAAGKAIAPVRLPVGSTVLSFYCQLYDNNANQNMNVSLFERFSDDNGDLGTRLMARMFSVNTAVGHQKVWAPSIDGSPVIKHWDSAAAGGAARYYTYYVAPMFPDGNGNYKIKSCAIGYNRPAT